MKALKINLTKNISDLNMLVTKLEKFFEENNISSISMPMTLILEELLQIRLRTEHLTAEKFS